MLKREWGAESKGKYRTYSIPGKAAVLIPEFAVEDLPLTELQCRCRGSCGSSGKALGYGLDGPGSISGVGGGGDFLQSFVSRLLLGSTQPSIK